MDSVEQHCLEINRCNQRGGRMLSIVDLIDARTVCVTLAAYLLAAIRAGASFMVGALPGGAGKTTVMGALLNFVPPGVELRPADGGSVVAKGLKEPTPRCCYVCHEIGTGPYYAYLWGRELRDYFRLAEVGHQLATNLHADTLEEAKDQVCTQNGLANRNFRKMNLILFLRVPNVWFGPREVVQVWESDGASDHCLVFEDEQLRLASSRLVTPSRVEAAAGMLARILRSRARSIEQVRGFLLQGEP